MNQDRASAAEYYTDQRGNLWRVANGFVRAVMITKESLESMIGPLVPVSGTPSAVQARDGAASRSESAASEASPERERVGRYEVAGLDQLSPAVRAAATEYIRHVGRRR